MTRWHTGDQYLADFHARAGDGWARSEWDFRNTVAATKDKVHLDVQCARVDLRFDATARTVAATGNSEDDYCRSHR